MHVFQDRDALLIADIVLFLQLLSLRLFFLCCFLGTIVYGSLCFPMQHHLKGQAGLVSLQLSLLPNHISKHNENMSNWASSKKGFLFIF